MNNDITILIITIIQNLIIKIKKHIKLLTQKNSQCKMKESIDITVDFLFSEPPIT